MSKKMWNKIFKSKSNKNSKTLQAVNKINKRCSIYEEYQQLNAALDLTGQNEKFLDNSPTNEPSTSIKNSLSSLSPPTPPPTKIPQTTTTFTKVVNTLTLKRSQNPSSGKDLKSGNGNETKEKHSKKSEFKTISSTSLSSSPPPSVEESAKAINQTSISIDHHHNNSSFNTPYDASLSQQKPLTAFSSTDSAIATATSNLNLNNNNEYLACNKNLANPNFQQQQQQQKRLSQIVIVVRKLNTTASLTPTSSASDLATNLNNQTRTTTCIATTTSTNKLNNINTNLSNALENSSLTTASPHVVNEQNQLSVNTKHNFDVSNHYTNFQHDDRKLCLKDLGKNL